MIKFAALVSGLSLGVLALSAPASAQSPAWGGGTKAALPSQGAPSRDGDLAGGPRADDGGRYDQRDDAPDPRFAAPAPDFRQGGWDRPDAVGRTAAFFAHPRLNGRPVIVQYFRANQRRAEEMATDNFCRRVGFREGAYYALDRARQGAGLEDVLCIR